MGIEEKVVLKNAIEDVEIFKKDKYGNERYIGFIHGTNEIETVVQIEKIGDHQYVLYVTIDRELICSYHDVDSYKVNLKEW